jgi:argininosuccinate lyase
LGEGSGRLIDALTPDERRTIHPALADLPDGLFDPRRSVRRKKTSGSTHPASVARQVERARALLLGGTRARA